MSRHFFNTLHAGKPVQVLMGYDRPMAGYFMVIEYVKTPEEDEDDGYLYSNLYELESHPRSLSGYLTTLSELGIVVPSEMISKIEADGNANMGNKDVHHSLVNGLYSRELIR